MGCLPLPVTTHFCLTKDSKRLLVGTYQSAIWWWSECHLTVFCIDPIVVQQPNDWNLRVNWALLSLDVDAEMMKKFSKVMFGSDFWVSQWGFTELTNSDGTFLAGVAALVRQQGTVCALKIKVHKPSFSSLSISNHSFYFFVFSGTKI